MLNSGTRDLPGRFSDDMNAIVEAAEKYLRARKPVQPNDPLVELSDIRTGETLIDRV